jgi:Tol biopolymer transport system component
VSVQTQSPVSSGKWKFQRRYLWCFLFAILGLIAPVCLCYGLPWASDLLYDLRHCPFALRQTLRTREPPIVFTSNRDGNHEIYIMYADGSNQINLTNNPADDHSPAVSPDGKKIAFASNRTGNYQIFVMNIDGTQVTNLSRNSNQEGGDPQSAGYLDLIYRKPLLWTPDGKQLIFGTSDKQFYIMDSDGSHRQYLRDFRAPFPESSPDGQFIAFFDDSVKSEHGNSPVLVVEKVDGSSKHQLTSPEAFVWDFSWSSDSKQLAYTLGAGIAISFADSSSSRVIWRDGPSSAPTWSADGRYVAFVFHPIRGKDARDEGLEHDGIYVVPTDGSAACDLTSSLKYDDSDPSWRS